MIGIGTKNIQTGTGFTATVITGSAVRVTDVHLMGQAQLITGTTLLLKTDSVTGPTYIQVNVNGTLSGTESFVEGVLFPSGVFLVTGTSFAAVTINYKTEL